MFTVFQGLRDKKVPDGRIWTGDPPLFIVTYIFSYFVSSLSFFVRKHLPCIHTPVTYMSWRCQSAGTLTPMIQFALIVEEWIHQYYEYYEKEEKEEKGKKTVQTNLYE